MSGKISDNLGRSSGLVKAASSAQTFTLLSTTVASDDATIDIETTIDSTYANYLLTFHDLVPAGDNAAIYLRLAVGGTYATSGYKFVTRGLRDNSSVSNDVSTSAGQIMMSGFGLGSSTGEVCQGNIWLFNPSGTTYYKMIRAVLNHYDASATMILTSCTGTNTTATAVDGMQILFNSGNVGTGTFKLYGIT